MSTFAGELTDKIEEARGLLSNLFSLGGKKAKKPREMVDTIRAFLHSLALQQSALAAQALSPANQQAAVAAVVVPGSTNTVSPTAPVAIPTNGAAATLLSPSGGGIAGSPPNGLGLTIPSPAHGGIVPIADGAATPAAGVIVAQTPGGTINTPLGSATGDGSAAGGITSDLDQMVTLLYGDTSVDSTSGAPDPKAAKEVIDLMFENDLFRRLLENIRYLEFEARKFFTRVFEYALTQRRDLAIPYMLARRNVLLQLIHAYDEKDVSIALACDAILRACIQCEPITEVIFTSGLASSGPVASSAADGSSEEVSPSSASSPPVDMVLLFFRYLDLPTFINSHVVATFKLLLQLYPQHAAAYLNRNYAVFFAHFNRLLSSDNYLTKVQSFALLGELLIERSNQDVMMRYVNEPEHLKLAMMALRGPKAIQLAVFNVLKVFVPNPFRPPSIARILTQNKRIFLGFLDEFEKDSEDEVLIAHKAEMTAALMDLPDTVAPLPKKASVGSPEEAAANNAAQQLQQQQQPQIRPEDSLP